MVNSAIVEQITTALEQHNLIKTSELLTPLSIVEVQDILERSNKKERAILFRLLGKEHSLAVFELLDPLLQSEIFSDLHDEEVISIFNELDPDDRVTLLDELPAGVASKLIKQLNPHELALTSVVLGYPQGSIGRRMSPEFVHIYDTATTAQALEIVKQKGKDAETIYTLPVVDATKTLVGVLRLADLLLAPLTTPVTEIAQPPIAAKAYDNAEYVAQRCVDGHHLALPIVDKENKLVGIFTSDDAQDILQAALEEDVARAGAAEPLRRPYLTTPILSITKSRIIWLLTLAISGLFTVKAIDHYSSLLSNLVVLATFIPLLTGIGGNTGSQASTTITRALAVNDISPHDFMKIVAKELRVGFTLGISLGLIAFLLACIRYEKNIALVISFTIIVICTMAATVGSALPLVAKWLRADPAVFSTPFISTFCDATGLIIYFTIAKILLHI